MTLNIWELDEPIANNTQELSDLSDNFDYLIKKKITLSGLTIDFSLFEPINKIIQYGHPKVICFSKCIINKDSYDLFNNLDYLGVKLAINNCGLTPKLGRSILGCLNPYNPIDVDLSKNNLGSNDCSIFIESIKRVITKNLAGFTSINLSNNGFSQDIIDDLRKFTKEKKHYPITI